MRPIHRPLAQSVLHRVVMNVIHMTDIIIVVANHVFPESSLPDSTFAFIGSTARSRLGVWHGAREYLLDLGPAHRIIVIALGKRPDAMQMLRQDDDGINVKRMRLANGSK